MVNHHAVGRTWTVRQVLLLAVLLFVAAACSSDVDPAPSETAVLPTRTLVPPTVTPTPVEQPTTPTPTDLPGPAALTTVGDGDSSEPITPGAIVARALDALLAMRDIPADSVRLMSLDAFTWHDAAWDCEALGGDGDAEDIDILGYRVVFNAGSRVYVYHTDEYGDVQLCSDPQWLALEGAPVLTDPVAEAMVELSRRDAARRLDLAETDLALVSLLTLTWPDSSVGCPKPGADYDQRETAGYRIVFATGDDRVIYHTSVQHVVYCTRDEEILPAVLRRALPDADD